MHSFYLEPDQWAGALRLEGPEARHLLKALRLGPGEEILLLDGRGREAVCRITKTDRHTASLELVRDYLHPAPKSRVILAAGWGKAARRGWILEKSVELEASGLWFWQSARSQFPVPSDIKENWQGQLVAGAKQCGNPWLPELRTMPGGLRELVSESAEFEHKHLLVEHDHPHDAFLEANRLAQPGTTICVVGPEGGFTAEEVDMFKSAGFTALTMGPRVLRWETAALMALGLHWWARQQSA